MIREVWLSFPLLFGQSSKSIIKFLNFITEEVKFVSFAIDQIRFSIDQTLPSYNKNFAVQGFTRKL